MRIEHIALWAEDIELLKDFYIRYFGAVAGDRYHNPVKDFTSYFLTFTEGGSRLEIMNSPELVRKTMDGKSLGYAHIAISVKADNEVDCLTEEMRNEGVTILGEPRRTGDGYYESIIEDPEGNIIEIVSENS